MLNRHTAPDIKTAADLNVQEPEIRHTRAGVPVYILRSGTQEVLKTELVFAAGNMAAPVPLLATATNDLLDEGTAKYSSAELAEALDYFGAYLESESGADWSSVTLFTLSKFSQKTLPYLMELVCAPAFPEQEIRTYRQQGKQRLAVNLTKVDFLARRKFIQALFGEAHPYGRITKPEDYDQLSTEALKKYHRSGYLNGLRAVFIAGQASEESISAILKAIDESGLQSGSLPAAERIFPETSKQFSEKTDALQSAIRIGRRLFTRHHPDYFKFSVLNTILGGYFGSRLMSNIREDKGYTYGIGSGLVSQDQEGYFFISTEVGAEVREAAIHEIYLELKKLREELVSPQELRLVKNYLTGAFQRSIDGPFALADKHKMLCLNNLNTSYLKEYLAAIEQVSAAEIKDCANLYFQEGDLTEIVVGK